MCHRGKRRGAYGGAGASSRNHGNADAEVRGGAFTEELDRKLDGVVERLQENADTLICGFARECGTGGWKGLLGEVRRKLEEHICREIPEAAGRIVVELEMPHSGTLNCYASVRGMTAGIVYMDEAQARNAASAIEERVEELYQASQKNSWITSASMPWN